MSWTTPFKVAISRKIIRMGNMVCGKMATWQNSRLWWKKSQLGPVFEGIRASSNGTRSHRRAWWQFCSMELARYSFPLQTFDDTIGVAPSFHISIVLSLSFSKQGLPWLFSTTFRIAQTKLPDGGSSFSFEEKRLESFSLAFLLDLLFYVCIIL